MWATRRQGGHERIAGRPRTGAGSGHRTPRRLDAARAGAGSALLVRGEPGIGKSTLLAAVEEAAHGRTRVLRTTGREWERELPFAALATLLQPVLDRLPLIPAPQSAALRGALALDEVGYVEPFAVAAATLGLLALTAEDQPLLCVVDDAHWLDAASASVILFVAQRLGDIEALLLLAAREGQDWPRGLDSLPTLQLAGLGIEAGVELLARTDGHAIAPLVLSPQELQVALLVGEGVSNREAAARLILSPKTVEYHLSNAFRKLGVHSRVELAMRLEREDSPVRILRGRGTKGH